MLKLSEIKLGCDFVYMFDKMCRCKVW